MLRPGTGEIAQERESDILLLMGEPRAAPKEKLQQIGHA
jgi:hypothetical protein